MIGYDATLLSIIDSDANTTGTQIEFNDKDFQIADPANNNIVSTNTGLILLHAKVPGGNSELPRNNILVGTIHFQSQKIGQAVINVINSGQNATQLITLQGTTVDYSQNQITTIVQNPLVTSSSGNNNSSIQTSISSTITSSNGSTPFSTQSSTITQKIPNTGIADSPWTFFTFIIGGILIILGVILGRDQKTEKRIDED